MIHINLIANITKLYEYQNHRSKEINFYRSYYEMFFLIKHDTTYNDYLS